MYLYLSCFNFVFSHISDDRTEVLFQLLFAELQQAEPDMVAKDLNAAFKINPIATDPKTNRKFQFESNQFRGERQCRIKYSETPL